MKILIVCDEGLNRSATIRGQIQYWGHDCLTVGLKRNSPDTIRQLFDWSDLVILTEERQSRILVDILDTIRLGAGHTDVESLCSAGWETQLWNIGPDNYPRPYNKELLSIVKKHIKEHEEELKPASPQSPQ